MVNKENHIKKRGSFLKKKNTTVNKKGVSGAGGVVHLPQGPTNALAASGPW